MSWWMLYVHCRRWFYVLTHSDINQQHTGNYLHYFTLTAYSYALIHMHSCCKIAITEENIHKHKGIFWPFLFCNNKTLFVIPGWNSGYKFLFLLPAPKAQVGDKSSECGEQGQQTTWAIKRVCWIYWTPLELSDLIYKNCINSSCLLLIHYLFPIFTCPVSVSLCLL